MRPLHLDTGIPFPDQWHAYRHRAFGPLLPEADSRALSLVGTGNPRADAIARKLLGCCVHPVIITVECGSRFYLAEQRCRSRVCPRCARIRAHHLAQRITELVRQMDAPRFLTLTIRSTDSPLRTQVTMLRRRFAALRRTDPWKANVTQGVYTIEITHNANSGAWHPHLHAIIDGRYWPHRDLLTAWQAVVHDHAGVDIRAVHGVRKLANYLAAYVSKSCDLSRLRPRQLAEWAVETHGLRLAQTFGALHAAKPQTDDREPLPITLLHASVNRIAYEASWGDSMAEAILESLAPQPGDGPPLTPDRLGLAIDRYAARYSVIRPPPPPKVWDCQGRFA